MQTLFKILAPIMALSVLPAYSSYSETVDQNNMTQTLSAERQSELTYMVQQDCGSCHGMTLKGGLGPSLLPERVSVLPKQYLINAVTHGRQGTPMPPWGPLLKQNEIEWIVEQLQLGQLGQKSLKK
ncbi:MAG: cytochrome c [Gammaproteobacteria bacterium]|nr:cytochrome c [Gammaproteobacteria bacterium]